MTVDEAIAKLEDVRARGWGSADLVDGFWSEVVDLRFVDDGEYGPHVWVKTDKGE